MSASTSASVGLDGSASSTRVQLPALHLLNAEITSVTTSLRRQQRNAASSGFLGGSSSASSMAPLIGGGSTAASLTRGAIEAATTGLRAVSSSSSLPAGSGAGAGANGLGASMGLRTVGSGIATGEEARRTSRAPTPLTDGRDESIPSLLNGFTVLRAQLREQPDLNSFPLPILLSPFLRVILSPRVTGPITSAALQSLHRLLVYGIVRAPASAASGTGTPNAAAAAAAVDPLASQQAIAEIAHAVSHCRFEASDAGADELVLLRILAVMRQLVCADGAEGGSSGAAATPLADQLGDESICEMMETGLSMCCQMRLSDLLRRTAEQSTIAMARMLFAKLGSIPTSADEAFSADPNVPPAEPEHATLAAEPVGEDANLEAEKKLRRMTMPDPKSRAVPAAAETTSALAELKAIGEAEEEEEAPKASAEPKEQQEEQTGESEKAPLLQADAAAVEGESEAAAAAAAAPVEQPESAPYEVVPYGLPAIKEVLRVVISLLDPHNLQHTDTMRLLGLAMLCSIFEVSSKSIGRFPSLRAMVQDSACKHLFQLARSEHPVILALALRATATLFETMREHLKLQYELFLNFLLDRLAPTFPIALEPWNDEILSNIGERRAHLTDAPHARTGTPEPSGANAPPPPPPPPPPMPKSSDRAPATGESRELMLETLGLLLRTYDAHAGMHEYDVMVELWANFDSDIDCENMFERFVQFLCRSIYAGHPQHAGAQDSTQLFALDALLTLIAAMTERQEAAELNSASADFPLSMAESLSAAKSHKAGILAGAARFNEKPKTGLAYLEEQGLIDTSGQHGVSRAMSIAKFLKDCPRLDKKLLGDYISRPDNIDMLEAFISLFDFRERPVAEAMRDMLESFRLPGESQQINRITETFAKAYFASGQPEVASEDAVYVLAYSIIMLNTDLHNPNIRRHMSLEDYCRNLRGVNDGKDFNPEFLINIYDSIRRREIVMPEEHVGQLGFEYAWKEILRRSRKAGPLLAPNTAHFDKAMFESSWRPIVASIAHAFSSFRDEHLLERAISGFRQCAILASRFGMIELFDYMVQGLAGATGLLDASVPGAGALTNNANVEVDGQTITVSPLSVRFGSNFKGQLAAVVLFTIANGNGDAIRAGWAPVFEIFKNLFTSSLLPAPLSHMRDFSLANADEASVAIPLKPRKPPGPPPQDPRAQGGLFSTLSSYLLSPYQATQEPAAPDVTPEDVESSLCTVDCVASCKIDELYGQVLHLNGEALLSALQALKSLADRLTFERLATSGPNHEQHRLVQQRDEAASSGRSTPVPSSTPGQGGSQLIARGQQLPYDPAAIFVLEMLTSVACSADESSIAEAWSVASTHITSILHGVRSFHPLHVERAVASLLRLAQKASPLAEGALRDQIFVALDLLRTVPNELKAAISTQLIGGLAHIVRDDPGFARSQTEWSLILALVADHAHSRNAQAAAFASDAARQIAVERLTRDNFLAVVNLLKSFASGADTSAWKAEEQRQNQRRTLTEKKELADFEVACQARGLEAIAVLEGIKSDVPRIAEASGLTLEESWTQLWLPLMSALALQCTNGYRPVRQAAVTHLQRTLLAPEVLSGTSGALAARETLPQLFTSVLFPTLDELLKPEVYQKDADTGPGGMQETRMRTCALLCKIYLHYLTQLSEGASDEAFQELWLRILDYFDRLMHASKKDQLTEAIQENLKNVLLVMNASRLLLPPAASRELDERTTPQAKLWLITFERVGRFLPKLQEDLFPTPVAPPSEAQVQQQQQQETPAAIPYPPVEEEESAAAAPVATETAVAEEGQTKTEG